MADFMLANPDVFSADLMSQVSPAALFIGSEGSGKSSTVAGVIGRGITFTANADARENKETLNSVGTRAPTKITVSHDSTAVGSDSITLKGLKPAVALPNLRLPAGTRSLDVVALTPEQAANAMQQHMGLVLHDNRAQGKPGIDSAPVVVNIRTPKFVLPLTCFDLPGMVNKDHTELAPFSEASQALSGAMLQQWVLNPNSNSRAFAVTSTKQEFKFNDYLSLLEDDSTQFISDKVAFVLTGVDLPNYMLRLKDATDDEHLYKLLLAPFSGSITSRLPNNSWPTHFFLVCNAGMEEKEADVVRRYAKVQDNIQEEVSLAEGSRTALFIAAVDGIRDGYRQQYDVETLTQKDIDWEQWKAKHIGIAALRRFVSGISVQEGGRELHFMHAFCSRCYDALKQEIFKVNKLIDDVGIAPSDDLMIGQLVQAVRDTFHYVLTGGSVPETPRSSERTYPMPSTALITESLNARPTLLQDDTKELSVFPSDIGTADSFIHEQMLPPASTTGPEQDRDDGRRSKILVRLWRFLVNFHCRIALCAPKPATRRELALAVNQGNPRMVKQDLETPLIDRIQLFVKQTLQSQSVDYVAAGMEHIIDSAVDATLSILLLVPDYQPYLMAGVAPAVDSKHSQLYDDLRAFAHAKWTKAVTTKVRVMCQSAAESIATPIIPQFPNHFRLASVILPRDNNFVKRLLTDHNDMNRSRAKRDQWTGATLLKTRISNALNPEDVKEDNEVKAWRAWDWLSTDDSKKMLISMVIPILSDQSLDVVMSHTGSLRGPTADDVDAFNHQLLCLTRAIIMQYGFQTQITLPKTVGVIHC